jgi:hypothetical protein
MDRDSLTDKILKVTCEEIDYANDFIIWDELSEFIDRVDFQENPDVIGRIKNEAMMLTHSNSK